MSWWHNGTMVNAIVSAPETIIGGCRLLNSLSGYFRFTFTMRTNKLCSVSRSSHVATSNLDDFILSDTDRWDFTWTTTVGDDVSWRPTHHLCHVDRCIGWTCQHDGTVHRLRLQLHVQHTTCQQPLRQLVTDTAHVVGCCHRTWSKYPAVSPGFSTRWGMACVFMKSARIHINFNINVINWKTDQTSYLTVLAVLWLEWETMWHSLPCGTHYQWGSATPCGTHYQWGSATAHWR